MALQLGDKAPDFQADTSQGPISFHQWLGNHWGVLFSHPEDFTPVCTTELGRMAQLQNAFAHRRTKIIGLSANTADEHNDWIADIEEYQGTPVNYPIVADPDREIADLYGMIHPSHEKTFTVRTVFIIDPVKVVRLMVTYPMAIGRNFDEILRSLDALQISDRYKVATPVDWRWGDDVIILPNIPDEEARRLFPSGIRRLKPYLRFVPQPGK